LDGTEDFYRPWIDYKQGFGDICSEFWLGILKSSLESKNVIKVFLMIDSV